jgi:hypothetical protein
VAAIVVAVVDITEDAVPVQLIEVILPVVGTIFRTDTYAESVDLAPGRYTPLNVIKSPIM